jgi:hypothetical protein
MYLVIFSVGFTLVIKVFGFLMDLLFPSYALEVERAYKWVEKKRRLAELVANQHPDFDPNEIQGEVNRRIKREQIVKWSLFAFTTGFLPLFVIYLLLKLTLSE